ncbi:MAG: ABC transporter ATP-binding protein [Candidatus Dormibacteraeota bacterium]|nr:ABC transporter ATP-binding protein [Candidatus Dormibacteraeota bacterium]
MTAAVSCRRLRRVYTARRFGRRTETVAVDDIDLEVGQGEVFGLLGPNGAGKTTTIRMLSTLLLPTGGEATVLGRDLVREGGEIRKRIGLVLGGDRGLYGRLTGLQNLRYFAALNYLEGRAARRRAEQLLDMVGLQGQGNVLVERYSRGMRQRLHIARGLMTDPELLYMDEPTIGVDPVGAAEIRRLIPVLVSRGKTILLTTHYMLEADHLCDRIAIIDHGRIAASGTPAEIKAHFSRVSVLEVLMAGGRARVVDDLAAIPGVHRVDRSSEGPLERLVVQTQAGDDLREAVLAAIGDPEAVQGVVAREPTLEEAYVSILR